MIKTIPTVLVVDGDRSHADGLKDLLGPIGLRVLSHRDGRGFLDELREPPRPACVLLDAKLPGMGGLEVQRRLTARGLDLPVVFLSSLDDAPAAVHAMKQGAVDYLVKPAKPHEVIEAVQRALERDRRRREHEISNLVRTGRLSSLTAREREVLQLVVEGLASKDIGARLAISKRTVDVHRGRILSKLDARSTAELVRLVLQGPGARAPE